MKPITAVVLGAGNRGEVYSSYAKFHPDQLKIVAVADPRADRLAQLADTHGVPTEGRFATWQELLAQPRLADVAFVCTLDDDHTAPAIRALEAGYHVLLEKPMSNKEEECRAIEEAARRSGRVLTIGHVLRYTPFYQKLKELVDAGEIGEVCAISQIENVAYWHQAHSFVRGNWRISGETSPMILAKSCHDMDIMLWLVGHDCQRVSSFGSLRHFRPENAPAGAPARCLDGCPHSESCPYYAPKIYLTGKTEWPVDVLTTDLTPAGIEKALREGPYGRCVYHCDNDVVDRQVVSMEFEGGAVGSFVMTAFTADSGRQLKIMGTKGHIQADMSRKEIVLHPFGGEARVVPLDEQKEASGHGGGDYGLLSDFLAVIRQGGESRTSARASLQSHLMCFAAEQSRVEGRVVELEL